MLLRERWIKAGGTKQKLQFKMNQGIIIFLPRDCFGPDSLTNTSRKKMVKLKFCLQKETKNFCTNTEFCEQILFLLLASKSHFTASVLQELTVPFVTLDNTNAGIDFSPLLTVTMNKMLTCPI